MLLVHGSLSDRTQWAPLRRALRRLGVSAVAYDRAPPHPTGEQPPSFAPDVAELRAHLIADGSRTVVGASYGGAVAAAFALAHPGELDALVLVEPTLLGLLADPQGAQPLPDPIDDAALAGFCDAMAGEGTWARSDERARDALRAMAPALAEESRRLVAFRPSREALRALDVPVLVATAGRSPAYFREIAAILETALPRVRRLHWEEAGHDLPVSRARELAEALHAWLPLPR
ncbi:MAG TPA: alpha/beta fold hydrolase [Candidatus Dormibacteraeota bacterium]|nr:alpha/beta fold hydrolase [Candidatus Dormibacteraeota bacterium]